MKYIDVIVSPFFKGGPLFEEKTGVTFEAYDIYPTVYRINKEADLSGVKSLIRKNILVLVEGEMEETVEVKEQPLKQDKFIPETAEEALEETKEEIEEQEEKEEEMLEIEQIQKEENLEELTVAELKKKADALGIEYKANISKSALLKKMK